MRLIAILTLALLGLAAVAGPARAENYEWTGSSGLPGWNIETNWTPQPSNDHWPGETAETDRVEIPYKTNQPEIPNDIAVSLLSLKMFEDPQHTNDNILTLLDDSGGSNRLTITEVDGLYVEVLCILRLGVGGILQLDGGGYIVLDGRIEHVGGGASILLADHKTFVTTGAGTIRGTQTGEGGLDNILQISGGTLVLGPDNQINGQVLLYSQTVNYGVIDPYYTGSAGGHVLYLACEPKVGPGEWSVYGGSQEANTMEVWTPIAGSGGLTVGPDGVLNVHRYVILYGPLTLAATAVVNVDAEVLFSVDQLDAEACPQ